MCTPQDPTHYKSSILFYMRGFFYLSRCTRGHNMRTEVMNAEAEPSIIAQATALLRKLTPDDLRGDDNAEIVALREAGIQLFGRAVLHARYGEQDVVAFLREQAGYREMLRRLERLQKQIAADRDALRAPYRIIGAIGLRARSVNAEFNSGRRYSCRVKLI